MAWRLTAWAFEKRQPGVLSVQQRSTHGISEQCDSTLDPVIQRQQIMQRPMFGLLDQLLPVTPDQLRNWGKVARKTTYGKQIRHHPIPALVVLLHLLQRARRHPRSVEFALIFRLGTVRDKGDEVECGAAVDGECEDVLERVRASQRSA